MFNQVPTKIDFVAQEHEVLSYWDRVRAFETRRKLNEGKQTWSFLDGPITANDDMGVHHAWGRTYKDAFHRYWAMKGYDTRYQNGFDCQGLWVEVQVERELGYKSKRDIEEHGLEDFVNLCKRRVLKYAARQTEQSIRIGYTNANSSFNVVHLTFGNIDSIINSLNGLFDGPGVFQMSE